MARPPSNERTTPTHSSHHHFTVTTSQYTMKIGIHAKVTALVLLLAKDFLVTQAHFIWQQTVADSNGESTSTMITFAENPGLAQAGVERFAHMVHEKGMHVYIKGIEDYDSLKEISTSQVGKYVKGQLPDSITKSQDGKSLSYAVEGFCRWGVWAEGGPPSLLLYYTSASHIDKPSDRRKVKNASQNIFRLSLYLEDKQSLCEGTIDSDFVCVAATAEYASSPLPAHNVTFYDGDTGEEVNTSSSNSQGVAYVLVPTSRQRVFARVNHNIENPGKTADGEEYDSVSNWATSVLEITPTLSASPIGDEASSAKKKKWLHPCKDCQSSQERRQIIKIKTTPKIFHSVFILLLVSLSALIGSFLGGLLSGKINRYKYSGVGLAEEEVGIKVANAERC